MRSTYHEMTTCVLVITAFAVCFVALDNALRIGQLWLVQVIGQWIAR